MKTEIQHAMRFLVGLLTKVITKTQRDAFIRELEKLLHVRYRDHWFPNSPCKDSGFRCIRFNGTLDPLIEKAGENCGLDKNVLLRSFPSEMMLWINPYEVSYSINNGPISVIYDNTENVSS